jgi:hypothetical protein
MMFRGCALAAMLALSCASTARAQAPGPPPPATIQLLMFKGSYIFGITAGEGAMYFQGQTYPLSIGGVSVGLSIGGSTAELVGEVYNIWSPADIEGVYAATKASYAVGGGETVTVLRNARGVELHLSGKQIGLEISLDLSGLSISLQ